MIFLVLAIFFAVVASILGLKILINERNSK